MVWKVKQLIELFDVDRKTIHRWGRLVASSLDERANPGEGKSRSYTPRDVAIIQYVARLFRDGVEEDQVVLSVTEAVDSGQFDRVVDYPELLADEGSVPVEEVNEMMAEVRGGLTVMERRLQALETENQQLREKNAALDVRVEMMGYQIDDLKERLEEAQEQAKNDPEIVAKLREQLAAASTELEMLHKQIEEKNKRGGLFRRG